MQTTWKPPAYDNVKNCARRPDNFEWEYVIMCPITNPYRSCFSAMRVSQGKHRLLSIEKSWTLSLFINFICT